MFRVFWRWRWLGVLVVATVISMVGCVREEAPLPLSIEITFPENTGHISIVDSVQISFNQPLQEINLELYPLTEFNREVGEDGLSILLTPHGTWAYDTTYDINIGDASAEFTTEMRPSVSIFAGGDVMLDMRPGENIAKYGPEYVFAGVSSLMESADIRFINLENPTSELGEPVRKNFRFRSPPSSLDALVSVRINVASFSNNHSFDYGEEAFLDTLEHLDSRGIKYVGAGRNREEALRPVIFEHNGLKVAFVSFMQRTILPVWSAELWEAGPDKSGVIFLDGKQEQAQIVQAVQQLREEVDVVLVSLHWGFEGTRAPQNWQRELARTIIDAGADAIIGHHPHLPFGIENYSGKPIIYSMGNMLFHPYDPEARESFVVMLNFGPAGLDNMEVHPILMHDGTVSVLEGTAANAVLDLIAERSLALDTQLTRKDNVLLFVTNN